MRALKNLSVRAKLFIIALIPLVVFGYFLLDKIGNEFEKREITLRLSRHFEEIEGMSALVHELQLERGIAFRYLVIQREENAASLEEQQAKTNKIIASLKPLFVNRIPKPLFILQADSIDNYRENVSGYLEFLNRLKWSLLDEVYRMTSLSLDPKIESEINTLVRILQAKEYLARIRSNVEGSLLKKQFAGNEHAIFASLVGQYKHTISRFEEGATTELLSEYQARSKVREHKRTFEMIDQLFNDPLAVAVISETDWWFALTATINGIKQIEDRCLSVLRAGVTAELSKSRMAVISNALGGILLVVITSAFVLIAIRQVSQSLSELKLAAERISEGEIDHEVNQSGSDEISAVARSFNRMIAVSKQYIDIASAIGKGDYSPYIKVRSKNDTLGLALINMKDNLQHLSIQNENRTWLLTANARINDVLHGDKEVKTLSSDILRTVIELMNGLVGTLYIRNNGQIRLAATYACDAGVVKKELNIGEGLVGQAARDGRHYVVEDIPDDYLKVNSSLGSGALKTVVVYPFHYEGGVKCIIELGVVRALSPLDFQFLETISHNISIAIQAAHAREQLKQLLEETQRQSEELVAQQEELTIANEELQQKTELLERSEEELRVQQEELQQSNEELHAKAAVLEMQKQEIEDAKLVIEEKAQLLEKSNKYKSEFLANMSHELRTPLNSILILSQVLMENRQKRLADKDIQFARTIFNSGSDLMELINEVLDLSKIEAGKMELDIESFALTDIGKEAESQFSEQAKQKSIQFDVEVEAQLFDIQLVSDKQRIQQILKNFLSNAFKFTEDGGKVRLSISAFENRHTPNPHMGNGACVAFSVIDTGIGIPPDKIEPIFEAFRQLDGSSKRKYGGTGLGLSISRELAGLLGGEIHVESKVGQGSTFTLVLPLKFSRSVPPATPSLHISVPIGSGNGESKANAFDNDRSYLNERKIVVVVQDAGFGKQLISLAEDRKYKGILATHGIVGLNYIRHHKPDAAILGTDLPGMGGVDILKHIKSDPHLRHIPVQLVSDNGGSNNLIELGAFNVIQTPASREDLDAVIDRFEGFLKRKMKKLLIVEDNQTQNDAIVDLIGNGDVKCEQAFSGEEAYSRLLGDHFDCIILDLGLPDMSGFTLLEKIKETEAINRIPVIVYTGRELTREESQKLGALSDAIVMKTAFSPERLLDETTLFLHRVETALPKEKQVMIRKLHKTDEILKGKKVLIADDDVRNVYSLVAAFEQEGLICLTAENGRAALEKLKQNPDIALVMMDVMMPEVDGYEATREIRRTAQFAKLPVIALTAKAMKGDREKCLESGMSDYISKPINVQQLLSLMRVWLYA